MREGFSLKEAAEILGIHPRRVTQSLDPTLERIARLWIADPTKTMQCILCAVARVEHMTETEIQNRERANEGRPPTVAHRNTTRNSA